MQVKKDEIRLSILKEAEKEFLEKGFVNASLRKIVKAAGTTIGNFYNYFDSKEILFEELVIEEYHSFINLIQNHNHVKSIDYSLETTDIKQWRKILPQVIEYIIPALSDKFFLLIEGSKGTRFEGTREVILKILRDHVTEHQQEHKPGCVDLEFADIVSEQFLNGITLILKKYRDETVRKRLITEHILFYAIGTMGLLEVRE